MEQQKESMESIVKRAPKEATHYMYPDEHGHREVFLKIDEDMVVESTWISSRSGCHRVDYGKGSIQPVMNWERLVELDRRSYSQSHKNGSIQSYANLEGFVEMTRWIPNTGDIVLFKRNDSIDYAYDTPERMEVVTVAGDKVWLRNALRDLVTDLDNISPLEKEKSLREELIDIMSCGGRWDYVNVDQAADRLIAAGIKLEGMQ